MTKFPVRVFKLSHYVDVVVECDDEKEAHAGAVTLLNAGKIELLEIPKEWIKGGVGLTIAVTLPAKVTKIRPGQDVRHLIGIPGKGSKKVH